MYDRRALEGIVVGDSKAGRDIHSSAGRFCPEHFYRHSHPANRAEETEDGEGKPGRKKGAPDRDVFVPDPRAP
nr:hypothetical protein [uncultured archaeon]